MGKSLSPVVINIFIEHFEEIALDTAGYKPAKLLRYVNDTLATCTRKIAAISSLPHQRWT
jgi:hypothetical protein